MKTEGFAPGTAFESFTTTKEEAGFRRADGFTNADGDTADTISQTAAGTACAVVGIPPALCAKGASFIHNFINGLGKSGASTGDPAVDKQLCGSKPGPLSGPSKWKTYHDCLMNKGIQMKAAFNTEVSRQMQQSPEVKNLVADPNNIDGTWNGGGSVIVHIKDGVITDHPEGNFTTTFTPGNLSFSVNNRSAWSPVNISADGKTLTFGNGGVWNKMENSTTPGKNPKPKTKPTTDQAWGMWQWGGAIAGGLAGIALISWAVYAYTHQQK